jgi:serine/threonine-protein kinase
VARRQWRRQERAHRERSPSRQNQHETLESFSGQSREDRIRSFRRKTARAAVTVGALAGINLMFSPGFPWFLFPAIGMTLGLMHRGANLWADGIRLRDIFGRQARDHLVRSHPATRSERALPRPTLTEQAEQLAPREVVAGPYGTLVRRAASDRTAASEALAKLSPPDRALIPDVAPTLNALAERVGSLALALHRMNEDVTPNALTSLDRRIEEAKVQPESADREKKLALLARQHATLDDLLKRRETLKAQIESASLMLQNMRLDLLALGSAGVQSAINDVSSATQEARALSRDIQIALEAAKEIR